VELVDLPPTLLELAGIDTPPRVQGRSLVPLLTDGAAEDRHKQQVISHYDDTLNLPNATHGTMCFDGRYKSVCYAGSPVGELYDLEVDPGEFDNLWPRPECSGLKERALERHLQALMDTIDAGIPRSAAY